MIAGSKNSLRWFDRMLSRCRGICFLPGFLHPFCETGPVVHILVGWRLKDSQHRTWRDNSNLEYADPRVVSPPQHHERDPRRSLPACQRLHIDRLIYLRNRVERRPKLTRQRGQCRFVQRPQLGIFILIDETRRKSVSTSHGIRSSEGAEQVDKCLVHVSGPLCVVSIPHSVRAIWHSVSMHSSMRARRVFGCFADVTR